MQKEFSSLIRDSIRFVEQNRSLPFFEGFLLEKKSIKKRPVKKPIVKVEKQTAPTLPKAEPSKKQEPPKPIVKETAAPLRETPVISEKVIDRFEDVKMHVRKVLPEIPYIQDIPTDQQAKIIAENWKYHSQISPFIILYNSKNQKEKTFLENLAKALSVYFVPTKVIFANEIEKENRWEVILDPSVLKFIIAPDDQIWDLPHMMSHYSENPAKSLVFLDEVPLFLIPNLSMYFQDPTLKSSLWKAICQKVSALQLSL
ncbi:MAG: hypothetical protein COT84_01785 [Chlamydiae bacterium CG10_big_fil_rev_8_21_14_0_10_35_9]|nr:MAG: hypothetical protein COT84_01785 [Chlamydiae bacterium CG10_big_fil_rev_8_21_14_0_10_35_9]